MTPKAPLIQGGSEAVTGRLAELIAIETRISGSCDQWGDAVREHPEAAETIDRMRKTSKLHHEALERRIDKTAGRPRPNAPVPVPVWAIRQSASEALRCAAEAALAAAFVYEAAYQTARLAYDGDTCDALEANLSDYGAAVGDARRALPHTVARELRRLGVDCACRCPSCSIGACGCVRNTIATAELAWGSAEPNRELALTLLTPPRPGSQLADAGLEEGDQIVAVDDESVGSNAEMQAALRRRELGQDARLLVERRGGARSQVIVHRVG